MTGAPTVTKILATSAVICAASASLSSAAAVTYVNDTFSDNERLTSSLPGSVQWTIGAHHDTAANAYGTLDASSGKMVVDHTNAAGTSSFAAVWGHFAPSAAPVVLKVGESMKLTFDVSFADTGTTQSSGSFRWALLNSRGSRVTSDFAGKNATGISSGSMFSTWRGFEGQSPINKLGKTDTGADMLTRVRAANNSGMFTSGAWTNIAGSAVVEPKPIADTVYSGALTLTRTATQVQAQASLAGVETSLGTYTPGAGADDVYWSFDTVGFFVLDGLSGDVTLDNIRVVVPEPASAGLLAVAGIAVLGRRRRR